MVIWTEDTEDQLISMIQERSVVCENGWKMLVFAISLVHLGLKAKYLH